MTAISRANSTDPEPLAGCLTSVRVDAAWSAFVISPAARPLSYHRQMMPMRSRIPFTCYTSYFKFSVLLIYTVFLSIKNKVIYYI